MLRGSLLFVFSAFCLHFVSAQNMEEARMKYVKTINENTLKEHLYTLASDDFQGRETGKKGNNMAADYISGIFRAAGLETLTDKPSYEQPFVLNKVKWSSVDLVANGQKFDHLWDYYSLPDANESMDLNTNEIVFVGYGIQNDLMDNYRKADVKGKVVMMYDGEPMTDQGNSLITGTMKKSDWGKSKDKKIALAESKGAKAVLFISESFNKDVGNQRRRLLGPIMSLDKPMTKKAKLSKTNNLVISPTMAKTLMGKRLNKAIKLRNKIAAGKKTKAVNIKTNLAIKLDKKATTTPTQNVAGFIRGKKKPEEYIIVTAHYDHLGVRGDDIFNGADDNASGTSTVLNIAQAFAEAAKNGIKTDRSIIFMLVSGEEMGLLGSDFYGDNPIIPLEKTMVNVNIDMVGRIDEKYAQDSSYIYVIGADRMSTMLHKTNEAVNKKYSQMTMDYTYNAESDPNRYYYRSDHYNFAKRGVPAIFFFNGTHEDYHRPSDTKEKIAYNIMAERGRHFFQLIWELSNLPKRLEIDVEQKATLKKGK